jgi:AcrR family transcriptional regulator
MNAVEELLATRTDLDLSLREITACAGTNVAAVSYYFGSKDALVQAVIERVTRRRGEERLASLRALCEDATVEDIVDAWISPSLSLVADRPSFFGLLGAYVTNPSAPAIRDILLDSHNEAIALYHRLLAARLPQLSGDELTFRLTMIFLAIAGLVSGAAERPNGPVSTPGAHMEDLAARTREFFVGALKAPPARDARAQPAPRTARL